MTYLLSLQNSFCWVWTIWKLWSNLFWFLEGHEAGWNLSQLLLKGVQFQYITSNTLVQIGQYHTLSHLKGMFKSIFRGMRNSKKTCRIDSGDKECSHGSLETSTVCTAHCFDNKHYDPEGRH